MSTILFGRGSLYDVLRKREGDIASEIEYYDKKTMDQDSEELCEGIYSKYNFETPIVRKDGMYKADEGEKQVETRRGETRRISYVKIAIPFSGSSELLNYSPSQHPLVNIEAEIRKDEIHLLYVIDGRTPQDVKREIDADIENINEFLKGIEKDVSRFNSGIKNIAKIHIENRRNKLKRDQEVIDGLGIPDKRK